MIPAAASERFALAVTAGDVAGALECWAEDAVLVAPDGSTAAGHAELAERFKQLVESKATVTIRVADQVTAGDTALATTQMTLTIGEATTQTLATVVYRREPDGWRIVIDRVDAASG